MTAVRISVDSPMGDVTVEQSAPDRWADDTAHRAVVEKLVAKAVARIHAAYGIEEKA